MKAFKCEWSISLFLVQSTGLILRSSTQTLKAYVRYTKNYPCQCVSEKICASLGKDWQGRQGLCIAILSPHQTQLRMHMSTSIKVEAQRQPYLLRNQGPNEIIQLQT